MRHRLIPYPASNAPALTVDVTAALRAEVLTLNWQVTGAGALKIQSASTPDRTDGLWKTTCFEAFLRPRAGVAYLEFNFSPSSQWAAYRFSGYRAGVSDAAVAAPAINAVRSGRVFEISASIGLAPFAVSPSARLGLAAVLETTDGAKSYWALAHTGDKPDFHRADAFIARLPFESRA